MSCRAAQFTVLLGPVGGAHVLPLSAYDRFAGRLRRGSRGAAKCAEAPRVVKMTRAQIDERIAHERAQLDDAAIVTREQAKMAGGVSGAGAEKMEARILAALAAGAGGGAGGGAMTVSDLSSIVHLGTTAVRNYLGNLQENGLVVCGSAKGRGRTVHWRLAV